MDMRTRNRTRKQFSKDIREITENKTCIGESSKRGSKGNKTDLKNIFITRSRKLVIVKFVNI